MRNHCIISVRIFGIDFTTEMYWNSFEFLMIIEDESILASVCCVPSYWYIHLMNHSTSINLSPNTYTYDFMMTSHNNMNCFLVTLNIFLPKLKNYCGKEECITVNMFFRFCLARKCTFFLQFTIFFSSVKLTLSCRIPIDELFCIRWFNCRYMSWIY